MGVFPQIESTGTIICSFQKEAATMECHTLSECMSIQNKISNTWNEVGRIYIKHEPPPSPGHTQTHIPTQLPAKHRNMPPTE